ncbi:MAG: MetQ/NlpA family ABC transporter substrate-binding protein [Lachnospiraceae bacterium]|nr:MetQ/NlpA family ABC transporter substrate-binding protein [Lachnospiraceae bacterium]
MKKKLLATVLTAALAFGAITGCGSQKTEETAATDSSAATTTSETTASTQEAEATKDGETRVVKLGLTGVIYEDIWNPIKEKLAGEGIDLQYVQFSDFSLPNAALDAGEIDINAFQHHAYFNNDTEKNGYDLTAIGDTFIIAMNIYSDQIQSIDELKDGDTVAIPDDASNGGRALKVLESAGIIEIDPDAGANPTVSDITNYKVQVDITELGASTIPSVIPDFTIAVVNGNYALDYGIDPSIAIFKESEYDDDSYFCLIAVKSGNADDPVYQEIVKLFQSEETKQIFEDKFGGYFVPAWEAKTK